MPEFSFIKFLVCLIIGHRYGEWGYVMDTPMMDGPEYNADPCCHRCWLDFDGWDMEDVEAGRDNILWRLRNYRDRK